MPKYKWKIEELLFEEDVRNIYDHARLNDERVLVSLLWLTGARPAELMRSKANEKKGITIDEFKINTNSLEITLKTLKRGTKDNFQVKQRNLVFERGTKQQNIYIETIINHIKSLLPESELLPYTTRWGEKVINRLGREAIGKPISPYHFRHSVMTWLMQNGKSELEVQYFKGASSLAGVRPYLHAKPNVIRLENLRRNRTQNFDEIG